MGYMLAVVPLVSLTDRQPARRIYLASSVLSALSCFGIALCDSLPSGARIPGHRRHRARRHVYARSAGDYPRRRGHPADMIPASHPACVLVRDQASMNCGRSAGTVEYPAKPRISAPHIAATIAAEGPTGTELAELTAQQFRVDCRRSRRERSWLFPLHQKAAIGHPGNAPAP